MKIKSIEENYKKPGYVFVVTLDGHLKTRKVYSNRKGEKTVFIDNVGYRIKKVENSSLYDFEKAQIQELEIEMEAIVEDIAKDHFEEFTEGKAVKHCKYLQIKTCVENDIPVYLYGPTGSGKNFTLQEIATDLNLDFYFTNSVQQEFKITGFIDAGGNYHETEFYKAFKNGGLFFLDEMDASIPEVLVLLNAAIANRYFEFPNGKVDANENFRVVAAGNTIGNGANEQYTGRMELDQATLDRFVAIEFDYDINIEMALAKGNKDLVNFIRDLRAKSNSLGVRTTFSYRCIISTTKLEKSGMDLVEILRIAILKGLDKDTISTIIPDGYTKYHQAIKKAAA